MAQIVGRKQELKELVRLQNSDESEMVVVYGRRRVGKTFLINRAFADTGFTFKVTGLYHQKMKMQLDTFSLALKDYFRMTDNIKFNTWLEAFDALKQSLIKSNDTEKKYCFLMSSLGLTLRVATFSLLSNGFGMAGQAHVGT